MRQRPISTLIFGILNIPYGLMYLAGPLLATLGSFLKFPSNPVVAALKSDPAYVKWNSLNMGISLIFGLSLLSFGIGLLLLQNWARLGSIIYAMLALVYVPVSSLINWPFMKQGMAHVPGMPPGMMEAFTMIALVMGLFIGMGYAGLLLFFMTRSSVIEACQSQPQAARV